MAAGSLDTPFDDGGRTAGPTEIPTWVMFVAGGLSVAVGAAALIWPKPTLMVIGILFGVYLALWGAVALMIAVGDDGVATGARILGVLVGVLGLLAGLLLMVRPGQSVLTIVWVLGFWWCVLGVMQLIRGIVVPGGRLVEPAVGRGRHRGRRDPARLAGHRARHAGDRRQRQPDPPGVPGDRPRRRDGGGAVMSGPSSSRDAAADRRARRRRRRMWRDARGQRQGPWRGCRRGLPRPDRRPQRARRSRLRRSSSRTPWRRSATPAATASRSS